MRKSYPTFPKGETLSHKLNWSHYVEILKADDALKISFYLKQCENENWSVRELKRQMKSMLFHCLALSNDKKGILSLSQEGQNIANPEDIIKDLYVLEFLNIPQDHRYLGEELEQKLIKFATRIPVFMYLTDFRERSLKDVITQLEPGLFKKVTGLDVKDFELLVSLGVFNSLLMNDAVYKFKRYEDASLEYIGINKHKGEDVGLYDTVLSSDDYVEIVENG